ncbi:MAG: DUF2961 domain-containing protein [Planctomycetes bacterium]|nr:DUF2961 domain-containing protein [Planctomycetota bacterium]
MRNTWRLQGALWLGTLMVGCATPARTIDTRALLGEMTDLGALAEFPHPAYACRQFSSYDRASETPDNHEQWFANADWGKFLRIEEHGDSKEYVMVDADGPGAIVRIWSANPKGTVRVYLDHDDTPVIEAPLADLLGGKYPGLPVPIVGERSRGWNSYMPMPYAKHCKITCDEGGFYYHVNYRTYAPGTSVVSFKAADLEALAPEVQRVLRCLESPRTGGVPAVRQQTVSFGERLSTGDERTLAELKGTQAIGEFTVLVEAADMNQALRETVLMMTFDGEETVACPLGDFSGAAPGVCAYESLPLSMTERGELWCHWVMPFSRHARIRVHNHGQQEVRLTGHVTTIPYRWTRRPMHFHAKWRTEADVPTRPMQDWNYLQAKGQGVFVGAAFAIANPVRNWWGEGDEKIYVDGETFPSHFGTGTEDYYGYAWCCNEPFTHAYHNQPRCDGPGNYGHTAVNRWHIIDRIPFKKSFRFDMELWHWQAETNVTMSIVAYWYARPGGRDGFAPLSADDLHLRIIPEYVAPRVAGALEGEEMRVIEHTAEIGPQAIYGCSNDSHLWWRDGGQPGDKLVLGFSVAEAGDYRIRARFVRANDYGIVRLALNDDPAGEPLDLYNDRVAVSDEIDLGVFELPAGENRITAEVLGANDKALKKYMFGLDYIRLERVP